MGLLPNSQFQFSRWRQRVWREAGELLQPPAMIAQDRYGGGSDMLKGGINMTGRTELTSARGMSLGSARETKSLSLLLCPTPVVFQDDNARDHRAHAVQDHLHFRRTMTLPWPAKSPDLCPIAHSSDILRRCVQRRPQKPTLIISNLSLKREGRWGTADDFATSFLHFSLFSTAF